MIKSKLDDEIVFSFNSVLYIHDFHSVCLCVSLYERNQ